MVLMAVASLVVIAIIGLSVDIGSLFHLYETMQTAADSAAVAGAKGLQASGNATAAADQDASLNGFTNGSAGVTITVNNPPASGEYEGNNNYVQVQISQPEPTYFLSLLGISSLTISTEAAATMGSAPGCIYSLDPNDSGSLGLVTISGGATVKTGCGIIVDSGSSSAISVSGGGSIQAASVGIVGNYSTSGGGSISPTPVTGMVAADDPLDYLQPPTVGTCTAGTTNVSVSGGKTAVLSQGTYCGGISVSGGSKVTLNSGTYILEGGGLQVSGSSSISGSGVTFYNTQGGGYSYSPINISGGGTINLSAPTSGALAGILIFEDPSIAKGSSGATLSGGSSASFTGAIYLPHGSVSFSGGTSGSAPYTIIVADDITFSGSANLGTNYSSLTDGSPIKAAVLSE